MLCMYMYKKCAYQFSWKTGRTLTVVDCVRTEPSSPEQASVYMVWLWMGEVSPPTERGPAQSPVPSAALSCGLLTVHEFPSTLAAVHETVVVSPKRTREGKARMRSVGVVPPPSLAPPSPLPSPLPSPPSESD